MVTIRERRIGNEKFFYLEHTMRVHGKVEKIEKYLGKTLPKDIERLKQEFFHGLFKGKWCTILDKIKENFNREFTHLPNTAKEKYVDHFLIKFTYNSNRIEGNTLTLKDTTELLKDGISPKNKPVKDIKEVEAHKKLFEMMLSWDKDLTLSTVLYWHKILMQEVDEEIAGKIRDHQVAIAGTNVELPLPAELDFLLHELFVWYRKEKKTLHPVELAALVHLKFVSIHPFTDGNGRMSRLMMNFILHRCKFPMLDISYTHRRAYYTALERSQKTGKEYIFVQYIIKKYIKEYGRYIK